MKYGRLFALLMAAAVTATSFSYGAAVPVSASELMEDEDILVTEPEDEEGVYDLTTDGAMGTENEEEGSIDSYDAEGSEELVGGKEYRVSELKGDVLYFIEDGKNVDVILIIDDDKELTGVYIGNGDKLTIKSEGNKTLSLKNAVGIDPIGSDPNGTLVIESGTINAEYNDGNSTINSTLFTGKELTIKGGALNVINPEGKEIDSK